MLQLQRSLFFVVRVLSADGRVPVIQIALILDQVILDQVALVLSQVALVLNRHGVIALIVEAIVLRVVTVAHEAIAVLAATVAHVVIVDQVVPALVQAHIVEEDFLFVL